jgi:hypothetical protein
LAKTAPKPPPVPYYVSPQALALAARAVWVAEHADASAEEVLAAIREIDAEYEFGEYRDEVSGERLVWTQPENPEAQAKATAAVSQAYVIQEARVGPIRDDPDPAVHERARVSVESAQAQAKVDAESIAELTSAAGAGVWEVYDPARHGEPYRPYAVPAAVSETIAKEGEAATGGGGGA